MNLKWIGREKLSRSFLWFTRLPSIFRLCNCYCPATVKRLGSTALRSFSWQLYI